MRQNRILQQVIIDMVISTMGISADIEIELNNFAINLFHKTQGIYQNLPVFSV